MCVRVHVHAYIYRVTLYHFSPRLMKQYSPLDAMGISLSKPGNPSTFNTPEGMDEIFVRVEIMYVCLLGIDLCVVMLVLILAAGKQQHHSIPLSLVTAPFTNLVNMTRMKTVLL